MLYVRLVLLTSRKVVTNAHYMDEVNAKRQNFIYSVWHSRILLSQFLLKPFYPKQTMNALISSHGDGDLLAKFMAKSKITGIRGSSNVGAVKALVQVIRKLKSGENLSITPDGPRGPRMRISSAVVEIAQRTGAAIIAVSYSTSRAKFLNSWDRFQFPLPFGRIELIFAQPIYVPRESSKQDLERIKKQLEGVMNDITWQADEACGHEKILPADKEKLKRDKK